MFDVLFSERGLSLDRLRVLIEVHDAGSISQSAPGEPVKQSQYSRQLRELSQFFGCELTERNGKVVKLTSDGSQLAEMARGFLRSVEDFYLECRSDRTLFTIAAGDSLVQWLIIPRIGELLRGVAQCRFTTMSLRTFEVVKQLADGRIDFGVIRRNALPSTLKASNVGTISYTAIVPDRLRPKKIATLAELFTSCPVAMQITDGEFTKQLEIIAYEHNPRFRPALACQSFPQTLAAVATGSFAAVLPEIAIKDIPAASYYKIWEPTLKTLQRDIVFAWNPRVVKVRPHAAQIVANAQKIFRI
ncbi:MAG: transcriptional regulator, LysR family [Verrucomicrobiales bacterium]|nr:transcriptional regulator, LysR family [Verrucomicrobiales bacterium]